MSYSYDHSRHMANIHATEALRIIRKKELALYFGVSVSTIYRQVKSGMLPSPLRSPSGNIIGWFAVDIENWLRQRL